MSRLLLSFSLYVFQLLCAVGQDSSSQNKSSEYINVLLSSSSNNQDAIISSFEEGIVLSIGPEKSDESNNELSIQSTQNEIEKASISHGKGKNIKNERRVENRLQEPGDFAASKTNSKHNQADEDSNNFRRRLDICSPPITDCLDCDASNNCISCDNSKYPTADKASCELCSAVITNCENCAVDASGTTTCTACVNGYAPDITDQKSCVTCGSLISECVTCSTDGSACLICNSGYAPDPINQSSCVACEYIITECATCSTDGSTCLSCNNSKYPSEDKLSCETCSSAITNCDNGCTVDSSGTTTCTTCASGYAPNRADQKTCVTCDSLITDCATCSTDGSTCLSCTNSKYPSTDKLSCQACDSVCSSCSGPGSSSCLACKDETNMVLSLGICSCKSGYFDGSSCKTCTIENCEVCYNSNICQLCKTSYYLNGSSCISCGQNCLSCNNAQCIDCKNTFFKSNQNPANCECSKGFYNNNDICTCNKYLACPENCTECTSLIKCISCKNQFYLQDYGDSANCICNNNLACNIESNNGEAIYRCGNHTEPTCSSTSVGFELDFEDHNIYINFASDIGRILEKNHFIVKYGDNITYNTTLSELVRIDNTHYYIQTTLDDCNLPISVNLRFNLS